MEIEKKLTKKITETTLGLSSVPTEYAHGRLPAHLVHEIIGHAYDTSAFTLHDMIERIAPIIEYNQIYECMKYLYFKYKMTTWLKHLERNYPEIYKRLDFMVI